MYEIKKNVPLPESWHTRGKQAVVFDSLNVGDCFDAPITDRDKVQQIASHRKRRGGREYTIRKIDSETIRCWRLK